jgi:predicted double-glycine peptidase
MSSAIAPIAIALAWLLPLPVSCIAGSVQVPVQAGGGFSVQVSSVKEARQRRTVIQQLDFSCGSAALATLLTHHYRFPVSEQVVFEAMYSSGDAEKIRVEGFSMLDMKRVLHANGFEADGFEASLDRLAEARLPAIALINEKGYGHFVVIKGLRSGRVLFGDPASGLRVLPRRAFESLWTNRILFVISSHQEAALFDSDADWLSLPRAPLTAGVLREGLAGVVIPKLGPSDN